MRRKFHVRFGGGPGEKVEQSNLARGLPCDRATARALLLAPLLLHHALEHFALLWR